MSGGLVGVISVHTIKFHNFNSTLMAVCFPFPFINTMLIGQVFRIVTGLIDRPQMQKGTFYCLERYDAKRKDVETHVPLCIELPQAKVLAAHTSAFEQMDIAHNLIASGHVQYLQPV